MYPSEGVVCSSVNSENMNRELPLPMNLIATYSYEISGRGPVYSVDLAANSLSRIRSEFEKALTGTLVTIDNKQFKILAVESFATGDHYQHTTVGILVKEILEKR